MDYSQIRLRARQNLAGAWAISIAVAAVAVLLGSGVSGTSFLPKVDYEIPIGFLQTIADRINEGIRLGNLTFSVRGGVISIVAFLLGGVVELGHAQFLLNQHDGKQGSFNDLFSQFHRFGQGFTQKFLRSLYVILWSLLLIIPGIIAGLSYAMTPFIMIDHPELSASEAIQRSKDMMDGHKMDLFLLDLTFLGWAILCGISGNLGYILLNPYTASAYAVFYRKLQAQQPQRIVEGYAVIE